MSRFRDNGDEGMPWGLWSNMMSKILAGAHGQQMMEELESALLELPEKKIISGAFAKDRAVCSVGLYVAHRRAEEQGISLSDAIYEMSYEEFPILDAEDTMSVGEEYGMHRYLAWHLGYLNDEYWSEMTDEERYEKLLLFVLNAQGKISVA